MATNILISDNLSNFRMKSTLGVAIIALFLLTPFAVNNFIQGRFLLGIGSLGVVVICAVNAWNSFRHRYYPSLILYGLVPAIIIFMVLAFLEQGAIVTYWCFPAILGIYFMLPDRLAWKANTLLLLVIYPVAWSILETQYMVRFFVSTLGVSAFSGMFVYVIAEQQKLLQKQAMTDPLTGLFNRMLLNDSLEQAIQQYQRTDIPMTLVAMDLDHFKNINDTYGHGKGDSVLQEVGRFLQERIRGTDKVFRTGGEEFLALLYDTDVESGIKVAEDIRQGFSSIEVLPDRPVTTSVGVATLQPGENWESWMNRCDQKLYQAKQEGRNRVVA